MLDIEKQTICDRVVRELTHYNRPFVPGKNVHDEELDDAVSLMSMIKKHLGFVGLEVGDVSVNDLLPRIRLAMRGKDADTGVFLCPACGHHHGSEGCTTDELADGPVMTLSLEGESYTYQPYHWDLAYNYIIDIGLEKDDYHYIGKLAELLFMQSCPADSEHHPMYKKVRKPRIVHHNDMTEPAENYDLLV